MKHGLLTHKCALHPKILLQSEKFVCSKYCYRPTFNYILNEIMSGTIYLCVRIILLFTFDWCAYVEEKEFIGPSYAIWRELMSSSNNYVTSWLALKMHAK